MPNQHLKPIQPQRAINKVLTTIITRLTHKYELKHDVHITFPARLITIEFRAWRLQ